MHPRADRLRTQLDGRRPCKLSSRRSAGLSLIELLVSLVVIGIVAASLNAFLVTSLGVRRNSQLDAEAIQFATGVLERHKSMWAAEAAYATGAFDPLLLPTAPPWASVAIVNDVCIEVDGSTIDCAAGVPPLRRVTVTITDAQGNQRARLSTEIGRPVL